MHSAPWTNTSISMGERWQIYAMSRRDSSRASTARVMPSSAACFTPSREWRVIWVEACSGRSGAHWRSERTRPMSCTSTASAPSWDAWTAQSTAWAISRSEHRVFRVRYTFTPRRWQ